MSNRIARRVVCIMALEAILLFTVTKSPGDDREQGTPINESLQTVEDLRAMPLDLRLDVFPEPVERQADEAIRAILLREPHSCVSVTGIFDLTAQLAAVAESNNLTREETLKRFQLIDFQLERQEREGDSGRGDNRTWKKCDIQVLRDVINSVRGIAEDLVSEQSHEAVILCPLPILKEGEYGDAVLHPRLADEKEAENAGGPGLLLYRYLDFDVEPEFEYRYRVRLESLAIPRDTGNETQWSPWSEPTRWTVLSAGNPAVGDAGRE